MNQNRPVSLAIVRLLVFRRLRLMAVIAGATLAAACVGWWVSPARYEVSARVLVQEPKSVNPFLDGILVEWTIKQRLPLIESVMKSHGTLEYVLRQLGVLGPKADAKEVARAVAGMSRRVEVIGLGGGLVKIKMQADSPSMAFKGVQLLMARFTAELLRPQKQAVQSSSAFLGQQIERLRGELAAMEHSVADFKSSHVTELPALQKISFDEHIQLRRMLLDAEIRFSSADKRKELSERKLRVLNPVVSRLEASLVNARIQLAQTQSRLTVDHPEVHNLQSLINNLRAKLAAERSHAAQTSLETLTSLATERAVGAAAPTSEQAGTDLFTGELLAYKAFENEARSAQAEVELLKVRLDESMERLHRNSKNEAALSQLTRDIDIKLALYKGLLEKYEDALVTKEVSQFDEGQQVWTVEAPVMPTESMRPALGLVLVGGAVAGLLLGLLTALVLGALDDAIRDPGELTHALGAPCIGELPRVEE